MKVGFLKKKPEIPEGEDRKIRVGAEKQKIWSAHVVIRKMQISVRMTHLPLIRLARDKKFYNIKFWQGARTSNKLLCENANLYNLLKCNCKLTFN